MSRLSRIPNVLFLVCAPIVLAGCQHPLAHSVAEQQNAGLNGALISAEPAGHVRKATQSPAPVVETQVCMLDSGWMECSEPADEAPAPEVQKQPEHPLVEMGNDIVDLLKIFTGR